MNRKNIWQKAKIGWYEPIDEDGIQKWNVKISKTSGFGCKRQEDAKIISMLARIMEHLGMKLDRDFLDFKKMKNQNG